MKTKAAVTLALLALAAGAYAATTKAIKSTRLSDTSVLVSCTNGSKPKAHDVEGSIVLSCGATNAGWVQ
jgi:hypothetical protein